MPSLRLSNYETGVCSYSCRANFILFVRLEVLTAVKTFTFVVLGCDSVWCRR
jgi:hypothetical protein